MAREDARPPKAPAVPLSEKSATFRDHALSNSGALAQLGQDLETGIAVGGRNARFSLKIAHRALGVAADAAVPAVGVKAERGQAALQFLHFGEAERALAARERLDEGAPATDAVGEVDDR